MSNCEKIHIETYGCSFNSADGETMAGVLAESGFQLIDDPDQADLVIMNTCTVKDRTYLNFEKRFHQLKQAADNGTGPQLVISGCIPRAYEKSDLLEDVSALGPDSIGDITQVVRGTLDGKKIRNIRSGENRSTLKDRMHLPARRQNPVIELLPISSGCLSACTFCQTRLARGRLLSYRPGDIISRAKKAVGEGARELWLTSQDTGAYGKDCDYPLTRLLKGLCEIDGDFRIRLGMTSPIWIHEDLDPILDAMGHEKMFKFLHIPLQSGSNRVLADMKRGNTREQFVEICDAFHARFPLGAVMTDIIIGFPTETENDYLATLSVIKRVGTAAVNRSKFSPRPGTSAAAMKRISGEIVSRRSRELNEVVRRVARQYIQRWLGKTERVITAEYKKDGSVMAHNSSYRPVVLQGDWPLGQWLDVQFNACTDFHLEGIPDTRGSGSREPPP
jgi:threonylcarbamoyladenosine tRNA methylthiotransferase CDKAL1